MTEPEQDAKILRFSGRRIRPTIHDVEQLRDFIESYAQNLEDDQIDGVGLILTTSKGTAHIDWMLLPGANKHALLSGTHLLGADLTASFKEDQEEDISDGN